MTSKPEPDKLGRNMKALPASCQKLADGIQQSWNRAIPENDYIQLGTLRYGVRLSNTGLLDGGGKSTHQHQPMDDVPGSDSRGSITSYELATNGDGGRGGESVHSPGGSVSSSSGGGGGGGEKPHCCCIGSSGVELPWTNTYARTKLPIPSGGAAKNRKSSPSASTASTAAAAATVGGSPVAASTDRASFLDQQQRALRPLPLAPTGRSNGHVALSPSAHPYGHGSGDTLSLPGGYSNGHNSNNNGYHSISPTGGSSSTSSVNGGRNADDPQQYPVGDNSPRCSAVVCCYGTTTGSAKCKRQKRSPVADGADFTLQHHPHPHQHPHDRHDRSAIDERAWSGTASDRREPRLVRSSGECDDEGGSTAGGPDCGGGVGISSGSLYRPDGGGNLNLNPRNAPQHQQLQQQARWRRKDANINNFEKKRISSEPEEGCFGSIGKGTVRLLAGEAGLSVVSAASPPASSCSPPSTGYPIQDPDPPSPGVWGAPSSDSVVGQRRRVLQPPSSLPVVKSYSFHRDRSGSPGAGQLFESPLFDSFVGRNKSFRNANNARRLARPQAAVRDGPIDGAVAVARHTSDGVPSSLVPYRVSVTRKSSLPSQPPGSGQTGQTAGGRGSVDECYPFDKSTCQPECILTPRSHRKHPCSDAINEIRLQSLSKYCNQLLLAGATRQVVPEQPGGEFRRGPVPRTVDDLEEEIGYIDSSDPSPGIGDDRHNGHSLTVAASKHRRAGPHPRYHQQQQQHSSIITHSTVRIAAAIVSGGVDGGTLPVTSPSVSDDHRNNYIDSSSDELSSVCSGFEQLARACSSGSTVPSRADEVDVRPYQASHSARNASNATTVDQYSESALPPTGIVSCASGILVAYGCNSDDHSSGSGSSSSSSRATVNGGAGSPVSSSASHGGLNCFGRTASSHFHAAGDKTIMEKRSSNTLDRLQRLVKKSTSGLNEKNSSSGTGCPVSSSGGKTERLRELTDLLKGSGRAPPPVPPPRRAKHTQSIDRSSFERPTASSASSLLNIDGLRCAPDTASTESDLLLRQGKGSRSVDLPYRFAADSQRMSTPSSPQTEHKPMSLRANVSTSNLEALHESRRAPPKPSVGEECKSETALKLDDEELFAKLSRPESRTIVGSYTQKTIPFRSASFSQVDYSSGKYIRSALGALKSSLLQKGKDSLAAAAAAAPSVDDKDSTTGSGSPVELFRFHPGDPGDTLAAGCAPDDTDVAKLTIKKTELSINLAPLEYDYGRPSHDERLKQRLGDGKDLVSSNRNSDIETIVEDPVAEHVESVENGTGEAGDPTTGSISVMQASEMVLVEPLVEEGIPITPSALSKDDECLQQATTCLIPVPVYDCVVSEWSTARPSEQWIDASMTEYAKFSDCLDSIKEVNESVLSDPPQTPADEDDFPGEKITVEGPPQVIEPQTSVELSEDGTSEAAEGENGSSEDPSEPLLCTPPVSIIFTEPESTEFTTIVDGGGAGGGMHKVSVMLDDGSEVVEVVEVRKRHSNQEDTGGGGDTPNCRHSNEGDEKRRLESRKSRRKGIYIQWPAIDGHSELEPELGESGLSDPAVTNEVTGVGWSAECGLGRGHEKDSSLELSGESFTDLSVRDEAGDSLGADPVERSGNCSPDGARYRLDPTTPESDPGKAGPVWPGSKGGSNRRQSLTYQSSDEKDDTLPTAPTLAVRSLKTLFLRSDSVSDNESDRASSRDRTSASPAPGGGDPDLRRYSKRPLRGPYGQMLEAEMKKPTTKVQYNEILEELTRNESHGSLTSVTRNRTSAGSQSMDETNDRHGGGKASGKPRKASANLPVPTHVRTASSPSKLSDSSSSNAWAATVATQSAAKRHLSNIEQRSTDSDRSEKSTGGGGKKFSLDSHHGEKLSKRASEGGGIVREKPSSKRSGSSASDKQPKRSLDEVRLSQTSRTPSERSITLVPDAAGTPKGMAASPELLAELLKGSSEKLITEQLTTGSAPGNNGNPSTALPSAVLNCLDTRTHVVVELFNTEKSYVESLQTIVLKYLNQLKSSENSALVDAQTVDEIFFMVPAILNIHERFLEELRRRLDSWDKMQMIGDAFVDVFSRPVILDTYTAFVNNWNRAKDAIRSARQKCPAFARFLEAMAREHKGKLSLDNLLIKPVQKFPNYELIFTRLIKHTDVAHPDQKPLQEALKLVHDILMFLNCKEKEALENGQRETALRELEGVIEGMNDLVTPERAFLRRDLVSMSSGQVTLKERGFFLFNDLLVITSIKRRSGTIRKTNMTCPGSVASTLDTNKYKYLTKISLDDLEIVKSKDENVRRIMKEIEHLTDDSGKLVQISDLTASLRCSHGPLEEAIRDLQREIQRQLAERQTNDAQLNVLELTLNTSNGIQNMTVVFSKPDKRTEWEETFTEAKQKLANSVERSQVPEFFVSVPIRKTRAGLQFTCASPTLGTQKDVWVCNSDGYVGQVCVLSLVPEPSVTSCNGVCNARILCVASVPASEERASSALMNVNISIVDATCNSNVVSKSAANSAVSSPAKSTERKGSFKHTCDHTSSRTASNESDIQLDSGSSSEDSEPESQPERACNTSQSCVSLTPNHRQQDPTATTACSMTAADVEPETQQSTMWLGTEDGCIHVYNCTDNIRIKKNKIKIPHVSAVYSILYLDNRVFVSLANGDVCVYSRDRTGWNVSSPLTVTVGTVTNPVIKLLNVHGKLWCAIQGTIKVLNTKSLQIDNQIQISNDSKPITNMTVLNDYVWISVQNSAHIKCCHHESFEVIFEVNLAPSVNKMLSNCDDIIRQHKAACLRVTSLLACKELIWVGTSAGVLLTIAAHNVAKGSSLPVVTGIPHGHTGHVRFLTYVESPDGIAGEESLALRDGSATSAMIASVGKTKGSLTSSQDLLVISGGDGYEDFRSTGNNTMSDVAGREDSTNHLLLWKV
ncbi:uncharacterized protein LOC131207502 [Anopheles bellator]|uniref:uncharacterized protein LOC131207502 n=1 Tax=Anopheles bellator TaxID=139047 RepID=UPI0026495D95|nr:uncharacterized protein LOC131207502 [Anopheles bellator]